MTMTAKFEIKANQSESNDLKYIRRKSVDERRHILEQKNGRILNIPDSDFFDVQTAIAHGVLQLEKYYKYSKPPLLPSDLDAGWKKFLLLWNKRISFTEKQCIQFAPKMLDACILIQGLTGPDTKLSKYFEALTALFLRAAKDGRQVTYSG